ARHSAQPGSHAPRSLALTLRAAWLSRSAQPGSHAPRSLALTLRAGWLSHSAQAGSHTPQSTWSRRAELAARRFSGALAPRAVSARLGEGRLRNHGTVHDSSARGFGAALLRRRGRLGCVASAEVDAPDLAFFGGADRRVWPHDLTLEGLRGLIGRGRLREGDKRIGE